MTRRRHMLTQGDNPLVRAVERVPGALAVKLLVAFVSTAVLLVVVGILGLQVIGNSNDRVATLGTLQTRATTYRELRTEANLIRALLGLRAAEVRVAFYLVIDPSNPPPASGGSLVSIDQAIESNVSQLISASDVGRL